MKGEGFSVDFVGRVRGGVLSSSVAKRTVASEAAFGFDMVFGYRST